MSTPTPTPRTDEQEFNEAGNYDVDWAEFARTLERELTDMQARAKAAEAAFDKLTDEVKGYLETRDALDNWELEGINRGDYLTLRERNGNAREYLESALSPAETRSVIAGLREDNKKLRAIFPEILKRLKSGGCAPECSIEFLAMIADEVGLVTEELRARVAELEGYYPERVREVERLAEKMQMVEIPNLEAQIAALISAGNDMKCEWMNLANPKQCELCETWDAAVSGAHAGEKGKTP